jgi:hypothetical protein
MKLTKNQRFGITTVYLTKKLKDKIFAYNKSHPNHKIIASEIAREAIEDEYNKRLAEEQT